MSEQPAPFAMKCSATGPGLGGGAAGVEAQFAITSADEDGARIRAGGARVQISVLRAREEITLVPDPILGASYFRELMKKS